MESPAGKGKGRGKKRAVKGAATPAQQRSKVVEQFLPTDVSHIRRECDALRDSLVYFVPAPVKTAKYPKKYLEEVVARLGGKVPRPNLHLLSACIAGNTISMSRPLLASAVSRCAPLS